MVCLRQQEIPSRSFKGRVAMQTPHPQHSNCLQCHVPGKKEIGVKKVLSDWQGLKEPKRGSRALLTSPPTVPHRIFMRENCLSCHGPANPNKSMRTTHPERTNCLQCHVPAADNEF